MLAHDKAHETATLKSEDCCCAPLVWSDRRKETLSLRGSHNRHVFYHGARGWKPQIKVPEAPVSCGDPFCLGDGWLLTVSSRWP